MSIAIDGVEIFRSGTWKGDKYTEADLDEIVSNFPHVGFDVPVKLGHSDDPGEPAYGWVEKIFRVGDRLLANLRDVPDEIYKALQAVRYDAVSAEIYFDLERNGRKFRRALKAIALLGAETPGVAGLKPLRAAFRGLSVDAAFRTYDFQQEKIEMTDSQEMVAGLIDTVCRQAKRLDELRRMAAEAPDGPAKFERAKAADELLHERIKGYQASHPGATYAQAMSAVQNDPKNAELVARMLAETGGIAERAPDVRFDGAADDHQRDESPGFKLHKMVEQHRANTGEKSYSVALKRVLAANPELKTDYARCG
jgi:hypothetical protein